MSFDSLRWRSQMRHSLALIASLPRSGFSRMLGGTRYSPRFVGAYFSRHEADEALDKFGTSGFEDDGIAGHLFELMRERFVWDYPMLFWLSRLLPDYPSVLDAGGHLGTKYIDFARLLDLKSVEWTVFDLPGVIHAARVRQAQGELPPEISFEDRVDSISRIEILMASGLLQYLDMPFSDFVSSLREKPKFILLNKVAVRDGKGMYTIERFEHGRMLYQIRDRRDWEAEVAAMGYETLDCWTIPDLGHVIPTHPRLGRSESRGYVLRRQGLGGAGCREPLPRSAVADSLEDRGAENGG